MRRQEVRLIPAAIASAGVNRSFTVIMFRPIRFGLPQQVYRHTPYAVHYPTGLTGSFKVGTSKVVMTWTASVSILACHIIAGVHQAIAAG